jgi:hypothetical protein
MNKFPAQHTIVLIIDELDGVDATGISEVSFLEPSLLFEQIVEVVASIIWGNRCIALYRRFASRRVPGY